jgi:histidinol phosphatase-like enzyme
VLAAARALYIDTARSWLIGDRDRDIEAAREAGLAGAILLDGPAAPPEPPGDGFRIAVAATALESLAILEDAGLYARRDGSH